ncbi:hypothetical protein K4K60_011832, partial [Colletotrichum sp. SAR11_57]
VKCDRGQPSCGWCSRNGALCEYKERKKPGLRAGYGRELEQRLDKLEEILRAHAEILQATLTSSQHNGTAPSIRNSNPSLPSDHGTPREAANLFRPSESIRTPQAETALFLQKPSTYPPSTQSMEFGMPPPTPSMHEFQGQMPMSSMPAPPSHVAAMSHPSSAAQEYYGTNQTQLHSPDVPMAQSQTSTTPDQELPPYDLLYALVDLYFKHINTWCPILHRKTTLDSLFGPSTLEETDRILLHAIVATTLRYSTDSRLTEDSRQHYHSISKQRVLLYGMENSSVKALQALVILALDLVGSSNGPPGWNIMALITRSVVQLGLAVESTSFTVSPNFTSIYTLRAMILPEPKDFIEEESRRRLFWMIYLLDRYATLATAFEFALDDKEIDRTLPCRDDLWIKNQKVETRWFRTQDHPEDTNPEYDINKPENLGAFSYYIEILAILSKIHKFLKQPVDISALSDVEQWQMRYKELDNMLTSWKFGLPGEYGNMAKLFQPGNKTLNSRYCGLLQRVLDEHRDSERQGDGVTPSSVKILADMRRTAFDLDFLISRQPRANGVPNHSRLPSVTPARTPAPNELEYLDVFDFFNVPRLPVGNENIAGIQHAAGGPSGQNGASSGVDANSENGGSSGPAPPGNEFNITNFMVDANSDWLFKQEGAKFLT